MNADEQNLEHLRKALPRVASPLAFAIAGCLVALGVLLRLPLDAMAQQPLPPYLTLYPAIVISAFCGGVRVGVAAMFASGAVAWALWIGTGPESPAKALTGLVYLFTGLVTVSVCGLARHLLDRLWISEERSARAARESVHRIKNLIAVVQSLSRKVAASAPDVSAYRTVLDERLRALGLAQDLLLKRDWSDIDVEEMVRATLEPFLPNPRLALRPGPRATLPREAATGVAMALYELATNSMKYGALASPEGHVRLEWTQEGGRCWLDWRETRIDHRSSGQAEGFGSRLIREALRAVPDAAVRYDIGAQTVSCVFEWPADAPAP